MRSARLLTPSLANTVEEWCGGLRGEPQPGTDGRGGQAGGEQLGTWRSRAVSSVKGLSGLSRLVPLAQHPVGDTGSEDRLP